MKYYYKIDGLRFLAIFLVLLEHFAMFIGRPIYAGFYGVDLFFVISGFLVTMVLLKTNQMSFKENYWNFIGRRTLRIFPIYYMTILALWVLGLSTVRENLIYLLTYTFNYAIVFKNLPNSPINPFWSLCVEEQFYLFWPFFVLSLKRQKNILLIVIILVIVIGYSQIIFGIFPSLNKFNYYSLLTRMASLGLGALGAIIAKKNLLPDKIFQNKVFEYFMLLLLVTTLITTFTFKVFVLGICSLYLIIKAAFYSYSFKPLDNLVSNKNIMYIGTISYGIYIYHMPIDFYFSAYILNPIWSSINFSSFGRLEKLRWHKWIIEFPLCSLLSILVAHLSFKYIESPILSLKDKFFTY